MRIYNYNILVTIKKIKNLNKIIKIKGELKPKRLQSLIKADYMVNLNSPEIFQLG